MPNLLELLKAYWKSFLHFHWNFNGIGKGMTISFVVLFSLTLGACGGDSSYSGGGGGGSSGGGTGCGEFCAIVINEVDYDQVSTDSAWFVEIYNPSGAAVDLSDLKVEYVNGFDDSVYNTVNLLDAGTEIPDAGYLVIGTGAVVSGLAGVLTITDETDLQNGAPDGLRIVKISDSTFIDGLSYEGDMPGVTEGTFLGAVDGNSVEETLNRCPNGLDSDDNNTDFALSAGSTPGAANTCL